MPPHVAQPGYEATAILYCLIVMFMLVPVQVFVTVCEQLLSPVVVLRYSTCLTGDSASSVTMETKLDTMLSSLFSRYSAVLGYVLIWNCMMTVPYLNSLLIHVYIHVQRSFVGVHISCLPSCHGYRTDVHC